MIAVPPPHSLTTAGLWEWDWAGERSQDQQVSGSSLRAPLFEKKTFVHEF